MAAVRSLWDDDALAGRTTEETVPVAAPGPSFLSRPVNALPLLPDYEYRPRHRHLSLSELDGADYDAAVDAADVCVSERDATLYGASEDVRRGWTKDAA